MLRRDFNNILDGSMDKWPPGQPNRTNTNPKVIMGRFSLADIWRVTCPNNRKFTIKQAQADQESIFLRDIFLVNF